MRSLSNLTKTKTKMEGRSRRQTSGLLDECDEKNNVFFLLYFPILFKVYENMHLTSEHVQRKINMCKVHHVDSKCFSRFFFLRLG